jgi:hypothetical protein
MLARLRLIEERVLPNGVIDVLRQVVLFVGAYYVYRFVRGAVDERASTAFSNAREIISFERGLGLFFEPAVQNWAHAHSWLIDSMSWIYLNSHFIVTTVGLAFIYLYRNESFYFVRNMFMIAMGLALVGYFVYPTAPPRLFPEWGFIDSVAQFSGVESDGGSAGVLFNPYAAVPSMHVGFALMLGWSFVPLVRSRIAKVLWFCYPLLVTFVVIVTGNHFWLDAAIGAAVAGISYAGARWILQPARPTCWAFLPRRGVGAAT